MYNIIVIFNLSNPISNLKPLLD